MTVKVTKPAVNLREKLAEVDKPSGIAGEAMLRAETPQEQFNLIGAGRKNLIINGGFDVWQRGTSFTLGANGYTADRWISYQSVSFAQSLDKSSLTELGYSADTLSNASNGYAMIAQVVENTSQLKGAYTLSFNIKSTGTGAIRIEFRRSTSNVTIWEDIDYATVSSDWQKITKTITLDETDDLKILIGVDSGTGGATVSIAQVQLELGKVATPFEHRSYGEELALCQRYYFSNGHQTQIMGSKFRWGSAFGPRSDNYYLPVTMRATPTITYTDLESTSGVFSWFDGSDYTHGRGGSVVTPYYVRFQDYNNSAGSTANYQCGMVYVTFKLDAEL